MAFVRSPICIGLECSLCKKVDLPLFGLSSPLPIRLSLESCLRGRCIELCLRGSRVAEAFRMNSELQSLFDEHHVADRRAARCAMPSRMRVPTCVRHRLEDARAIELLDVLKAYVEGRVDEAVLAAAAEETAVVANRHRGSPSIDGSQHSAVSGTYAVAKALIRQDPRRGRLRRLIRSTVMVAMRSTTPTPLRRAWLASQHAEDVAREKRRCPHDGCQNCSRRYRLQADFVDNAPRRIRNFRSASPNSSAMCWHTPPTALQVERAIALIEDTIMPFATQIPPALHVRSASLQRCSRSQRRRLAARQQPQTLTSVSKRSEALFSRWVRMVNGAPAAREGVPEDREFAAGVILLRECIHHLRWAALRWSPGDDRQRWRRQCCVLRKASR